MHLFLFVFVVYFRLPLFRPSISYTHCTLRKYTHTHPVDIEALKHAPNGQPWAGGGGMRHRRDSLSGLSTQSQPLVFGGGFGGTHSPAPTFHSGIYYTHTQTYIYRPLPTHLPKLLRINPSSWLSFRRLHAWHDDGCCARGQRGGACARGCAD